MILLPEESVLFYKLLFNLQYYVLVNSDTNQRISRKAYNSFSINEKIKYRNELWSTDEWINKYIKENPDRLQDEELGIIGSWKNRINDKFIIERYLKKYAVFIGESKVYGVLGITQDLNEIISPDDLPVYLETVLLPFRDKIIFDGLFSRYKVSFGRSMRDNFKRTYNKAKAANQILLNL